MRALLFRVEADPKIGMGHLMRCLSIADAARERGIECTFATSDKAAGIVSGRGYRTAGFSSRGEFAGQSTERADTEETSKGHQAKPERAGAEEIAEVSPIEPEMIGKGEGDRLFGMCEIPALEKVLYERGAGALIVDSYEVTPEYLEALHELCQKYGTVLVYIDDIAKFAYPCDVLINYNIYAPDWREKYGQMYAGHEPILVLGVEYAPLRAEFSSAEARTVRACAADVLVSTGGADTEHMGVALVKEILKRSADDRKSGIVTESVEKQSRAEAGEPHGEGREVVFHVVVGKMNTDAEELRSLEEKASNVVLHHDVSDMASLMRSCDAAISASGSTLCELCATQTPALTYILADNQIAVAEGFSKRGVMKCCGDIRKLGAEKLAETLIDEVFTLCADADMRQDIASRMRDIADAYGASRIVDQIITGASQGS